MSEQFCVLNLNCSFKLENVGIIFFVSTCLNFVFLSNYEYGSTSSKNYGGPNNNRRGGPDSKHSRAAPFEERYEFFVLKKFSVL